MKTAVIEGAEPGVFDKNLLVAMKMVEAPAWTVWNNEQGEIYRVMGVDDLRSFVTVLNKLRALRYTDEMADDRDAEQGFDTIARAPHERSGDRAIMRRKPLAERHIRSNSR